MTDADRALVQDLTDLLERAEAVDAALTRVLGWPYGASVTESN